MTETTRTVFEKYEVRKTKEQKAAFEAYVKEVSEANGYRFSVEEGDRGARNLVIGDVQNAKVVYTAHYDTCVGLPFPNLILPKCIPLYWIYQIGIGMVMVLPALLIEVLLFWISGIVERNTGKPLLSSLAVGLITYAVFIVIMLFFFKGPANRHTANDNTSGVTLLLDIMQALDDAEKEQVAFVFFDLEEAGLVGARSFAKRHQAEMEKKLLVNFDCVSEGDHFLFVLRKDAVMFTPYLEQAFVQNEQFSVEFASKGVIYPSDQSRFPCGVGVPALKKKGKLLYMSRIHTNRDTVYQEENIEYLKNGAIKLLSILP